MQPELHVLSTALVVTSVSMSALTAIPATVYAAQAITASLRRQTQLGMRPLRSVGVCVLMPAHNEAQGIEASIRSVMGQLQAQDRLLVIADNCTDNTAALARKAGAQVIERTDAVRRGKGYALDHGIQSLQSNPPHLVVMMDSDCVLHPGSLEVLAQACLEQNRPIQSCYLMHPPHGASLKTKIAGLAWLIKNHVRPHGWQGLGGPCLLTGSGMAFPWAQIATAPLASGHLVEDMQLGIDLSILGHAPAYCALAQVSSEFPQNTEAQQTQRTRWEHGHLGVIATQVPRLLKEGLLQRRPELWALALELAVPPIGGLIMVALLASVLGGLSAWITGHGVLLALPLWPLFAIGLGTLMAWHQFGRSVISGRELSGLFAYLWSKAPIYLAFVKKRQTTWIRTSRDDGTK